MIKMVDIKIEASGNGVVNWNGGTEVTGPDGKVINTVTMPKLRGYTNLTGKVKVNEDPTKNDYLYKKTPQDVDFKKTPLYISSNCAKHYFYKKENYDLHYLSKENKLSKFIPSLTGLVRGYVIAESGFKKSAALNLEDFVDELGNGNYEQLVQDSPMVDGKRTNTSLFSRLTFGDTKYTSYASINIEELQFLSLDSKFDRKMGEFTDEQAIQLASDIQDFIISIGGSADSEATFSNNYVRVGSIFEEVERGILLNSEAISALVNKITDMLENLFIQQAHGWMMVDSILVDYNDGKPRRIRKNTDDINEVEGQYKSYFYEKDA